jgi:protein SCO1/2
LLMSLSSPNPPPGEAVREALTTSVYRGALAAALWTLAAASSVGQAPTNSDIAPMQAQDRGAIRELRTALAASRAAVGRPLGDHTLTDGDGRRVRLADLRGRPLVVNMIYTSCFDFCPTLTASLGPKVEVARAALGQGKFVVLTVGFDTRNDTPARMRAYGHMLGLGDSEWLFLSGDEVTVAALAADIGFTYRRTAAGFDHSALTTIVDPAGRVYRQIYGTDYAVPVLVEPLKALVLGTRDPARGIGQLLERVRLLCTIYDPRTGRYRIDYALILSIALGTLCFSAVGVFLLREWRKERRARRAAAASR